MTAPAVRTVHVLPHTHWDREWYDPYPAFRIRLVELLDDLLDRLDADPAFTHFQLDGQMAAVDDYLEVRPERTDLLARLATEGRISMGPWYTLPDEFLVSGETLVRDLQLGLRRADDFGAAMRVGYLPDMFGHVSQMPQLLGLFGMDDAVVWRGVPSAMQAPAFRWVSPDGSSTRAEYLAGGYFNGADMPDDVDELAGRMEQFVAAQAPMVGGDLLWMAGMDHAAPPQHLPTVVTELARLWEGDGVAVRIGPLTQYLAEAAEQDGELPVLAGELRSGARANLLPGVASNRVDVKVAAAMAERTLERVAEPLDALWQVDRRWAPLLERAWLDLIRNAAHDSICACSHDDVVDAVLHRYAEATRTAAEVARRATDSAARQMAEPGYYVLNPSATTRTDVIELTFALDGQPPAHTQPAETQQAIRRWHDTPVRRVLASVARVPGFGWGPATPVAATHPVRPVGVYGLSNGLVDLNIDELDGTWSLGTLNGLGRLVDGGDVGDTYNWCPPELESLIDEPERLEVHRDEDGPLRGRVEIRAWYQLPEHADVDLDGCSTRVGSVRQEVVTTLELRADEEFVRVEVAIDQRCRDHRLRVHFPLPRRVGHSVAECAYAQVRRPLHAEGGPNEMGVATFPSRRFVRAGGLFIGHEGLCEYELVDLDGEAEDPHTTAGELALTLVRSTGWLSRGPMPSRPMPAGPEVRLEGAQCRKHLTLRYVVAMDPGEELDPYELSDRAWNPLQVVHSTGGGDLEPSGSHLQVRGAAVDAILPARASRPGALVVRVHEAAGVPGEVAIEGRRGGVVDLVGNELGPFEGHLALRPHQIVTLRLEPK